GAHVSLECQQALRRAGNLLRKRLIALCFAQHRLVAAPDAIQIVAHQVNVTAGFQCAYGRFFHRAGSRCPSHSQIVRNHNAAVTDLLAQDVVDPVWRERGGYTAANFRKSCMSNDDEGKLAVESAIGIDVLGPELLPRPANRWQM